MSSDGTGAWPSVVVVGTDGSETAGAAVGRAIQLCRLAGAQLHVVTAYLGDETAAGEHDRVVEAAADRARGLGVADVVVHRILGTAGEVLCDVAKRHGADVVVVGNQGMDRRVRFGNVPNWLAHHLDCSLLLIDTA
jgi:nucleotide-binding universal stress UspA family protein